MGLFRHGAAQALRRPVTATESVAAKPRKRGLVGPVRGSGAGREATRDSVAPFVEDKMRALDNPKIKIEKMMRTISIRISIQP